MALEKNKEQYEEKNQSPALFSSNKEFHPKVHSLENSIPKLKEQRRKKMYRRLIPLLLLFSFAILTVIYFISPLSEVNQISVGGVQEVTDQSVIDASGIRSGASFWETFFASEEIEAEVKEKLPQVKSLDMNVSGLNNFEMIVEEYRTVAYLDNENEYYNVLENGKIVNESRKVSLGNPPIFKNFTEGKPLDLMINQYQLLNETIHNSISEVEYTPSDTDAYLVTVYMNDGNQVVASIPSFAEKMVYYPDIVKKTDGRKGIVNIEVGAFFTPFHSNTDEEEDPEESVSEEND